MRRLREVGDLGDVPIIALSANVSPGDQQDSLRAGANAFLSKPIDFGNLVTHIAALLDLSLVYEVGQPEPVVEQAEPGLPIAPPQDQLEELHRLARHGNMRDIVQWASRLDEQDEQYRPFADRLRVLAKAYESKAILILVQRYLDNKEVI